MLSRQEQQRLTDIERWFRAADPDLARALSDGPHLRRIRRQLATALLAVMAGALLAGLGVVLMS
jgi:hypothetical protein